MCAVVCPLSQTRHYGRQLTTSDRSNVPPDKNRFQTNLEQRLLSTSTARRSSSFKLPPNQSTSETSLRSSALNASLSLDSLFQLHSESADSSLASTRASTSSSKESSTCDGVSRFTNGRRKKGAKISRGCSSEHTRFNSHNSGVTPGSPASPFSRASQTLSLNGDAKSQKKRRKKITKTNNRPNSGTGHDKTTTDSFTSEASVQVPHVAPTNASKDTDTACKPNTENSSAKAKQGDTVPRKADTVKKTFQDPEAELKCKKIKNNIGIVLDKPINARYSILDMRVKSFKNWAKSTGQDPTTLAEAGFYQTSNSNSVVCYHCGCQVDGLRPSHNPYEEHVKKFPYCAHIRQVKGDRFILALLGDEEEVSDTDETESKIEIAIERNKNAVEAAKVIFDLTDQQIREAVRRLTESNARTLFDGTTLVKTAETINQEKQNEKGIENKVKENQYNNSARKPDTKVLTKPKINQKEAEEESLDIDELKNINEQLKDSFACKVCFDNMAGIITLPCGHLATCSQCVAALDKCPLCRTEVKGTVKAMFAHSSM